MSNQRPRRPFIVTVLALAVLILSAVKLAGVYAGLTRWSTLASLSLSIPLPILMALDGVWGIFWLGVAFGLWRCAGWARRATLVAFPLYTLATIVQQAIFARGTYERGRLLFVTGALILLSALVMFVLTRPRIRHAFWPGRPELEVKETQER